MVAYGGAPIVQQVCKRRLVYVKLLVILFDVSLLFFFSFFI